MNDPAENSASPQQTSASDQARMAFVLRMRERGIADVNVLRALETVPRDQFVPRRYADLAWKDISLPIACGQIMPAPYIAALTMEALALNKQQSVLEIGAGSGYSTAILARLAGRVVSFERYRTLAVEAEARLAAADADNVTIRCDDGFSALEDLAAFDRIVVHMALVSVPDGLRLKLNPGGRLVYGRALGDGHSAGLVVSELVAGKMAKEKFIASVRLSGPVNGVSKAL